MTNAHVRQEFKNTIIKKAWPYKWYAAIVFVAPFVRVCCVQMQIFGKISPNYRIWDNGLTFSLNPKKKNALACIAYSHYHQLIHHDKQNVCWAQNISIISSWYEYEYTCQTKWTNKKNKTNTNYDTRIERKTHTFAQCALSCVSSYSINNDSMQRAVLRFPKTTKITAIWIGTNKREGETEKKEANQSV